MRFTNVLYQVNYHRHFQRIWKRQGKLQVLDVVIPPELEKMGVEIKDAKDFLLETQRYIAPKEKKLGPKILPPSVLSQNKYLYLMHEKTKVSENENQTLALTKTVPYQGLPKGLTSLIGVDILPNQDELVKTSLLQAQVWDAVQHKLPKKLDISRPQYRFRREYGIRYKRKVSSLLEKLTYLCDCATGKYVAALQRNKILDTLGEVAVQRGGDEVIYQMPCDILLTAEEPLKPFASAEQVAATEKEVVPNIYPIKPTLDLDKYTESPFTLQPTVNFVNENLHTLFIAQKSIGYWFPKQLLARAIATCFAFTASEAQRKYGHDVGKLPEPISVQCMYMDVKSFNFIAYQLNTLELSDSEGIKNQVWIDELSTLYDEVSEKDLITNYNPDIFPKMLAFYSNGIHPIRL